MPQWFRKLAGRVYLWSWTQANRVRRLVGRPARPKWCCRRPANLVLVSTSPDGQQSMRRCRVCQCRHFEQVVQPGRFGLVGR